MRFPSAHSCHPQQRGFTLLEVLIAVTITAVIGLGVWQVINGVVNSRDRVNELAEQFDGLQRSMLLLERDIMQVVNRPARDHTRAARPLLSHRDHRGPYHEPVGSGRKAPVVWALVRGTPVVPTDQVARRPLVPGAGRGSMCCVHRGRGAGMEGHF